MKEFWNIWEIAPKYDTENLRESYVKKEIFNIGDKVENLNTGLIGRIIRRGANRTIFDVLKKAHNDGYTNVRIVAGQDRVKEFDKLSQNYNGQLYQFDNMEVVSSGDRDPDAEGMELSLIHISEPTRPY